MPPTDTYIPACCSGGTPDVSVGFSCFSNIRGWNSKAPPPPGRCPIRAATRFAQGRKTAQGNDPQPLPSPFARCRGLRACGTGQRGRAHSGDVRRDRPALPSPSQAPGRVRFSRPGGHPLRLLLLSAGPALELHTHDLKANFQLGYRIHPASRIAIICGERALVAVGHAYSGGGYSGDVSFRQIFAPGKPAPDGVPDPARFGCRGYVSARNGAWVDKRETPNADDL